MKFSETATSYFRPEVLPGKLIEMANEKLKSF